MGDYVWFHDVSWHATYAIYFFVIGISAGLAFLSYGTWIAPALEPLRAKAAYGSFVLLAISGAVLIADLSQPTRFLNVLNPVYLNFSSPLAWGALNIVSFGLASLAYLVFLKKADPKRARLFATITALLALGLPVYTGYDLSVHQSRPVWNTPIMPVLFVALAVASGSAVGSLIAGSNEAAQKMLRQYMLWSTAAVGVIMVSILGTTHYGGSAQELTFLVLTTGTMGFVFVGLGLVAGTAAPLALLLAPAGRLHVVLALCALLILVGSAALRFALLMGPQQLQTLY